MFKNMRYAHLTPADRTSKRSRHLKRGLAASPHAQAIAPNRGDY